MYEDFYGLKKRPFSKTPDPEFLYMSKGHREALARLQHGVEEKDVVVLTGEVGCGKTTLSRKLMDSLDEKHRIITLVGPLFVQGELLRLFAQRLGCAEPSAYRTELLEDIAARLFDCSQNGVTPVLVVDEAQLIPGREGFDELRLLTNLQLDDSNMFALVLLGQPELRTRLLSGYFEPFRQRIGVQYHLNPLSFEETREYVDFRLSMAGREKPVFTDAAVDELFKFSGGVPRRINNIASNALLEGFGRGAARIDADVILDVARDFGLEKWNS